VKAVKAVKAVKVVTAQYQLWVFIELELNKMTELAIK
jgi:hypothetical protein